MNPEDLVASLAEDYDPRLVETTLARLRRRQAEAGRECASCGETKPLASFARKGADAMGLQRTCRACMAEYHANRKRAR